MTALQRKRAELAAKRKALADLYQEAGGSDDLDLAKITSLGDIDDRAKLDQLRQKNEELDALGTECESLAKAAEQAKRIETDEAEREERKSAGDPAPEKREAKSLAGAIIGCGALEALKNGEARRYEDVEFDPLSLKATFTELGGGTAANIGYDPESLRQRDLFTMIGFQEPMVYDAIPMAATSYLIVKYMEQVRRATGADAAATAARERDEEASYVEADYRYVEREEPVRNVGIRLPVTDEILEDEPWIEAQLNMDLVTDLRRRVSSQLLNGNGTAPNIRGILNKSGIQTQAKGSDSVLDAINKALVEVEVDGFAMPNLVILHPSDWAEIRRSKTTDGDYLFGSPAITGAMTVWGLPRVKTQEITEGNALVGDTMYCRHAVRRAVEVEVGYNADDFSTGRKTIRVRMRCCMVVRRATAFCHVTGV